MRTQVKSVSERCRGALAVRRVRVHVHRPAGDGLLTDVAGGAVLS